MNQADVAIVGAGPAGSSAAIFLARKGYAVALIDKERFPREKLCGDFINPINWPLFRSLGVEGKILSQQHQKVIGFRMTSFSGEEAEASLTCAEDIGLGLRRCDLDHILLKQAAGEGAALFEETKVRSTRKENSGWNLEIDHRGIVEHLRARVLIAADGRNSWVAHHLGMVAAGSMQGRSVGFQVRLKSLAQIGSKVEIHLFPGGYAGLVGLGDETITLGFAIDKAFLRQARPTEGLLDSQLSLNPHLKQIIRRSEVIGTMRSTYPVHFPPRRAYGDGILLVGDAARVSEPVTGEGIYFAMKSGGLAAKALDRGFKAGDVSARQLRIYERECRRVFARRRRINSLVRWLMYRPTVLSPLIRLSNKRTRLLDSVVRLICQSEIVRQETV
ncbi:MAG TPA: geranylgeranyl reductase family protein [Candidatus Acidoferrales bacterium]|nr:geranylgeranyl reductase family protein [Candidatus Acidoferrales bacterium]